MLKNAMGVGIPGTGMTGLPIAVALGALVGRSEYQLEVLKDVCPEAVAEARDFMDRISTFYRASTASKTGWKVSQNCHK